MEGQFTGPQTAADQQMVPRRGGAQPRPRVPAVALGPLSGGASLPAAGVLQQPTDGLRARPACPAGLREVEVRADPQRIPLAAGGEILPWRGLRPCARPGPAVTVEGWLALTAVGGDRAGHPAIVHPHHVHGSLAVLFSRVSQKRMSCDFMRHRRGGLRARPESHGATSAVRRWGS